MNAAQPTTTMMPPPGLVLPAGSILSATMKAAQLTAAMLPPSGLAPPPGLELPLPSLASPPGLEDDAGDEAQLRFPAPAHEEATVQISNLPNHILSDAMMEATLQQAGLEEFVSSIDAEPGKYSGQALVTLTSLDAAMQCICHFQGRRWGGLTVSAAFMPLRRTSKPLSADAPAFVPSSVLAAEAPAFIPATMTTSTALKEKPVSDADASTEDGESASENDL